VTKNKDGSLSKTSARNLATKEEILSLTCFVEDKIKKMAKEISEGNIEISPFFKADKSACDYCPYHGICRFDEKFPGFKSRDDSKADPEAIRKIVMGGKDGD